MIGGILFLLPEFKIEMLLEDNAAQLFVESWVCLFCCPGFLVTVELVSSRLPKRTGRWILRICAYMAFYRPHRLPFLLLQSSYEYICFNKNWLWTSWEMWHSLTWSQVCAFLYLHRSQFTRLIQLVTRYSVFHNRIYSWSGSDHDKKHRKEK